jgi:hypothetical protein
VTAAQSAPADTDPAIASARAAVLAEVGERAGAVAPTLRPLTLNARQPLCQVSAPLAAKLDARLQAGYAAEGNDYPTSRTWSRVVVPAIAVAAVDVPVVVITGVLAAFHVDWTWFWFIASVLVFVGSVGVAVVRSIAPLRDPLRLTTDDRRELNQSRSWQSRQPWMGPRSASAEFRLVAVAHRAVQQLADSPAWASRFLSEHRLRLNLIQELDAIDYQACQLAVLREANGDAADLNPAWASLVDRVARLRHYRDRVIGLNAHVDQLDVAARASQLDAQLRQLAVGSAMDQFAAESVRSLSADLERLTTSSD